MKPNIVNWAYIGLAFLWLSNMQSLVSTFNYLIFSDDDFVYSPVLSIALAVIVVVSTIAIFGLMKKKSWARMVACGAVGIQAFLMLGMLFSNIYLISVTPSPVVPVGLLALSVLGVSFLFLAYRLYASEPLKIYLSNPQLVSR